MYFCYLMFYVVGQLIGETTHPVGTLCRFGPSNTPGTRTGTSVVAYRHAGGVREIIMSDPG